MEINPYSELLITSEGNDYDFGFDCDPTGTVVGSNVPALTIAPKIFGAIGTVIEPVPVTGFAANFSPIPRMAPPPLSIVIAGAAIWKEFWVASLPLVSFPLVSGTSATPFGSKRGEVEDGLQM